MNRIYITLCIVFSVLTKSYSQEGVSIRLISTAHNPSTEEVCFDTQIKNTSQQNLFIAEQNYRLFYDALQLKFKSEAIKSFLPLEAYSDVTVNQSLHNIDARGYGNLKFGQNIGFLNFSISLGNEGQKDKVLLPPDSKWLSTTQLCFHTNSEQGAMNIVWARENLTKGYATAFTEFTAINEKGEIESIRILNYQDFFKLSDKAETTAPMVLEPNKND